MMTKNGIKKIPQNVKIIFNSACFFDKKMGNEVDVSTLGDEFKGYIFKIMGGNDK